jgi:hypothetical protein
MTAETDHAESVAALSTTAIYANRFFVAVREGSTRIAFGETIEPGNTNFHTSIIMSNESAKMLVDLILRLQQQMAPPPGTQTGIAAGE